MRCAAVILAGGSGRRMNNKIPKQFMDIGGKPVLWYSVRTFSETDFIDEIVIVSDESHREYIEKDGKLDREESI